MVERSQEMKVLLFSVLACTLVCSTATANLLLNGSFENTASTFSSQRSDGGMELTNGSTAIPDWTVFTPMSQPGNDIAWVFNTNNYGLTTPYGSYFIDLTGYTDAAPYAGVEQTITTTINTAYTLTYALMVDQSNALYAGPVGITATAGSTSSNCTGYNPAGTGNMNETCSLTFTATSTSTLISFQGLEGDEYIGLDNADVELAPTGIPEPAMVLPLLAGIGVLVLRKRK
jgi:uncharacterized protein DUF642